MYKFLLCQRYLRTRYIAMASIISVMLGVATMIVVNSVMAGFTTEMRDRIRGILSHVVVETASLDGQPDAELHMRLARQAAGDSIAAMTATIEVYGMLSFQYAGQWITRPVTIIGIRPEEKAQVGPFVDYLMSYKPWREDGEIIRPALRSRDEPPSWELTAEDREHRKAWIERQRLLLRSWENRHGSEPADGFVNPFDETQPSGSTHEPNEQPPAPGLVKPNSETGAPAESDRTDGDAADSPPFETTPPFESAPPFEDVEQPARDPAEPQKARVYLGIGLVSWPYEDPETGKVRTMVMVRPGEDVKISTVSAGRPPRGVHFDATVVDWFKSGMSEYDGNLVFCNLEELQRVRGMIDPETGQRSITSLQIRLKDYADAEEVVRRLRRVFPPDRYQVRTWEQKQGPLLAAVEVESAILNVLLFLIIAVAGFGILAIFYMIVVEKTRDIGILKALGASSRGVMSVFLSYGLALGVVGSGVGVVVGLLFVRHINTIEGWITWLTGRKVFDERIYYFPEIPTQVEVGTVLAIAAGAMAIAVLASVLPARRAARLDPVKALRYE